MRFTNAIRVLVVLSSATSALAGDWPDYRGPRHDGISDAIGLPLHWSESKNVRWKTPIHDEGWSSPVVYGKQVWLTTATEDGKTFFVICVDRDTGEILLDRQLFEVSQPRPLGNNINSYATPSPVIEDGRVYVSFGSYGTACIDTRTFEIIWQRQDLPCDHWRGPGSSPLLWEDLLFLHMDGADVQYIVALDKETGASRWVTFRSVDYDDLGEDGRPSAGGDWRKAYNTPVAIEFEGKAQLISPSAKAAYAYDPRSGRELWRVRHDGHSSAPRVVYGEGIVSIYTGHIGRRAEVWGVRVDGRGDVTQSHVAWKYSRGVSKRASPVLLDGRLYMVSNLGVVSCLDFKTGREIWKARLDGNYSASLVYADKRIHLFSEGGAATIVRPGSKFEVLSTNELDTGLMASPAIVGRGFILRTRTHLYRIEE